ncbi:unnamed protein product [Protopolystoma xenopodis]|uniref:Uncharacterized protein n=1 Tax=Protopolystoma xenopodis TaxID=117903 RepID=A0A448XQB0_9PLAT|nr:unnamed protein product [Protopolystoma xenopodis]
MSCSDDVRYMMDESAARINRGRKTVSRGSIRTNLHSKLQDNGPQLPVEPTYESLPLASSNEMEDTSASSYLC